MDAPARRNAFGFQRWSAAMLGIGLRGSNPRRGTRFCPFRRSWSAFVLNNHRISPTPPGKRLDIPLAGARLSSPVRSRNQSSSYSPGPRKGNRVAMVFRRQPGRRHLSLSHPRTPPRLQCVTRDPVCLAMLGIGRQRLKPKEGNSPLSFPPLMELRPVRVESRNPPSTRDLAHPNVLVLVRLPVPDSEG